MIIHVFNQLRQPSAINYCSYLLMKNTTCSHLCLPSPRKESSDVNVACACPTNMKLSKDGSTCAYQFKHRTNVVEMTRSLVHIPKINLMFIISGVTFAIILIVAFVVSKT